MLPPLKSRLGVLAASLPRAGESKWTAPDEVWMEICDAGSLRRGVATPGEPGMVSLRAGLSGTAASRCASIARWRADSASAASANAFSAP